MNKMIIVLCAIFALAKGQADQYVQSADRTDDFIKMHRLQFEDVVQKYDRDMQKIKEHYSGREESIMVQRDFVISSIVQTEERLRPLEVLSDNSKDCVSRYRHSIKTVEVTKAAMSVCVAKAIQELSNSLERPINIRNALVEYYQTHFETGLDNCNKNFHKETPKYTNCISEVVTNTTTYTVQNKKEFGYALNTAECDTKANIKRVIDCNFGIQYDVLTKLAEVNLLINTCIVGKEDCPPCGEHTCSEVYPLYVDYENATILNPFYGRKSNRGCLMLSVK